MSRPNLYSFRARLTVGTRVYVEADSPEEAKAAAEAGHWESDDRESGECVDWEIHGPTQLEEEGDA